MKFNNCNSPYEIIFIESSDIYTANDVHEMAGNPVVAFRGARVVDYNGGRSLSAGPSYEIRPDIPAANQLAGWLEQTGVHGKVDTLSERKSIGAITQENMGLLGGDQPDLISFKAKILFIKKDIDGGPWYMACANAGEPCNNRFKCMPTTNNQWYCKKCLGTYPNPVRRWIFSALVKDSTTGSNTWVSFFNEQAEALLGMTADECYHVSYNNDAFDPIAYNSVFAKVESTEWIFKCKVKNDHRNVMSVSKE